MEFECLSTGGLEVVCSPVSKFHSDLRFDRKIHGQISWINFCESVSSDVRWRSLQNRFWVRHFRKVEIGEILSYKSPRNCVKTWKGEAIWKTKKEGIPIHWSPASRCTCATKVLAEQRPSLWWLALWDLVSCYSPLMQWTWAPASSYTAWRKWTQHLQSWTIFALAHLSWQEAFVKWDSLCSSSACFD